MQSLYFDYAATTPLDPCVITAMQDVQKTQVGNPSSIHQFGQRSKSIVEKSRYIIAELINAKQGEIFFTSGGTESNNLALTGFAMANRSRSNHIVTTPIEHPSVLKTMNYLESIGFEISYIQIDSNGKIDLNETDRLISDNTILVSVMMANNETGNILDLKGIKKIAAEKGVVLHTDAVQALGKMDIDVRESGVDLLSISSHKIYGPKGTGALYVRTGKKLNPLILGGSQEKNLRAGTENIHGIAGFAEAAEQLTVKKAERKKIETFRRRFESGIIGKIPDVKINGVDGDRLISHSNIFFPDVSAESMLMKLDLKGLACSSGSACSSGAFQPSHVLNAMGYSEERSSNSLRFSFGRFTSQDEIMQGIDIIVEVFEELKRK